MGRFDKLTFSYRFCFVQFKMWSTADDSMICRFTADAKDKPHPGETECELIVADCR